MTNTGKKSRLLAVSKLDFFRRMDKLSCDREVVQAALRDLSRKRGASLLDLAVLHNYVRRGAEAEHVRGDWLNAETGWWQDLPAVEPILRAAFIKAGNLALRHRLPCDSYWVRGTDEFQVVVCKSKNQITMLICSPLPPNVPEALKLAARGKKQPNDIWVFGPETSRA